MAKFTNISGTVRRVSYGVVGPRVIPDGGVLTVGDKFFGAYKNQTRIWKLVEGTAPAAAAPVVVPLIAVEKGPLPQEIAQAEQELALLKAQAAAEATPEKVAV
jgi:hypothetical protein